jgi:sec-independent protein translocase protein TatB
MFDFDISKMILVGVVALVVVGPKELPAVLRTLGRALARVRRLQTEVRVAANNFMADVDIDSIEKSVRSNLALDPATAMRGNLPSDPNPARLQVSEESLQYASPEMQAYLTPLPETPAPAVAEAMRI